MVKRKKVFGTAERPRLSVFRSLRHTTAQLIDDTAGKTLVAITTNKKGVTKGQGNIAAAKQIGKAIAEAALAKGVKKVVFDRGRYLYHGRIKAVAEAAREGGLEF
jgi:large subunit ribosomal protein L18